MNARSPSYFRLGLFIVAAVSLTVLILIMLGVGALFRPTAILETYIDGSVQGLDVGAPLKLRGVTVGEVSHIGFTYTRYQQDRPLIERRQYVLVQARVRRDLLGAMGELADPAAIEDFVERGLRVRMMAQGLTGLNFLELDFLDPRSFPPIPIDWQPEHYYVPSAPSVAVQLMQHADSILRRADQLDIESLLSRVDGLIGLMTERLEALDVDRLNAGTLDVIGAFRGVAGRLDAILASPALASVPEDLGAAMRNLRMLSESPRLEESMDTLSRALAVLERVLSRADGTLAAHELDIAMTLDNLRAITDNLRLLSEDVREYPGIILQRPPPHRE